MSLDGKAGPTGKHSLGFVCPVPNAKCSGTPDKNRRYTFHGTPEAVRKCQQQYLIKQGYKKLNPREYEDPETGRVLVLSKRPARHKPGKQDRPMPATHIKVVW
jgi:hypothetical protein